MLDTSVQGLDLLMTEAITKTIEGFFVFAMVLIGLQVLFGWYQFQFVKSLKEPGAWQAFIPVLSMLQWWAIGKVSFAWFFALLIPGVLYSIIPTSLASLSVLLVLGLLTVLTLLAGVKIARKDKVPPVWGMCIVLPFVQLWGWSQFKKQKKKIMPLSKQFLWGFLACFISIVLTLLILGLLLYFSFYESIITLLPLVSYT